MVFSDDILKLCQKEIDDKTYCIDHQEDLPQLRINRGKAHFIMAMVLMQNDSLDTATVRKAIEAIRLDGGDNPSPTYIRMINAAQSYYDAYIDLID